MSATYPKDALCRVEGHPSWWDDELDAVGENEAQRKERHDRAKAICARCPVRDACRERFDPERDAGVWAGDVHERGNRTHGTRKHIADRKLRRTA